MSGSPTKNQASPDVAKIGGEFDQLLAPIVVLSPDSTLHYMNSAAMKIFGDGADRLVGRKMLDFIHPDDFVRVRRQLRLVANQRSYEGKLCLGLELR